MQYTLLEEEWGVEKSMVEEVTVEGAEDGQKDGGACSNVIVQHSPCVIGGKYARSMAAPPKLMQSLLADYFHQTKRMEDKKEYSVVDAVEDD